MSSYFIRVIQMSLKWLNLRVINVRCSIYLRYPMGKSVSVFVLILASVSLLSSCTFVKSIFGGSDSTDVSRTTGWNYNDPAAGGFVVKTGVEQQTGPGLVFIEGGTFTMGRTQEDVMKDWNNVMRRVTVESFYMDETEVRNVDYREYLDWLKKATPADLSAYNKALPDTLIWRSELAYNEPMVENYLRHPSYNEYPVVGVSWTQANDYCAWRTMRVNALVTAGQGQSLPRYRLPTEAEWEYAAWGLVGNTFNERVFEGRIYPWRGKGLRNSEGKNRGQMMANFTRGRGDLMGVSGSLNDGGSFAMPVNSFWPNDFGLYCMAGNVNEWVMDVYRQLSFEDVSEVNPFRGNVFPESDSRSSRDGDSASLVQYNPEVTLINDQSRVYKGGSWKDRPSWLSPGSRRYLDENQSRNDIGFRCAMTRVGTQTQISR